MDLDVEGVMGIHSTKSSIVSSQQEYIIIPASSRMSSGKEDYHVLQKVPVNIYVYIYSMCVFSHISYAYGDADLHHKCKSKKHNSKKQRYS